MAAQVSPTALPKSKDTASSAATPEMEMQMVRLFIVGLNRRG